jgi:hypothetical protein
VAKPLHIVDLLPLYRGKELEYKFLKLFFAVDIGYLLHA